MSHQFTDEQLLERLGHWLRELRAEVEPRDQNGHAPLSAGTEHAGSDPRGAGPPIIETIVGLSFAGPSLPSAQLETLVGLDQVRLAPQLPSTEHVGWDQRCAGLPMNDTRIGLPAVDPSLPPLETPARRGEDDRSLRTPAAEEPIQEVGLYRLVEEFTALRHELKLQTKSARGLEEQTQTLLPSLQQAIDAMRAIEPKEAQAAWSAGKPLAVILAELDEALDRGRQQTAMAIARLSNEPASSLLGCLEKFHVQQSWLRRRLHGGYYRQICEQIAREQQQLDRRSWLDALLDGYRMIQKRLVQALASEGITRIVAVGQPVDPDQMTVVQVVDADGQPAGVVFDEVRRGYTWNGRLLRYAEVRATRAAP